MTPEEVLDAAAAPNLDAIGATHVASALQAVVLLDGSPTLEHVTGCAQFEPHRPLNAQTPLDLASVSKVFTATAAMIAVDEGRCDLDSPISRWVPDWADGAKPVTLLHLLNHSSGLPAWDQFYLRMWRGDDWTATEGVRSDIEAAIVAKDRKAAGAHGVYSDLGYILLGRVIERLFNDDLETIVNERIAAPLGLSSIRYVSQRRGDQPLRSAAATELDPARDGIVVGVVHDENCYIQGGVAGHAGLFGTAQDVAKFGQHLLDIDRGARGIVSNDLLRHCWSDATRGGDGHFLGGWDTPSGETSTAGRGFAAGRTVGHLGFTGTSIWIERDLGLVAVLLTNRVYPTRENAMIKDLRIAFHEAVLPPRTLADS